VLRFAVSGEARISKERVPRAHCQNEILPVERLPRAYRSTDLIVVAAIERAHVEVANIPAQDWALRVTLVFRKEKGLWLLAHRHADALAGGISVEHAAALARGSSGS